MFDVKRILSNVRLVFLKEILETLRDRRTLFLTVFLPIILYPLLILGMSQLVVTQIGKLEKIKIVLAVRGRSAVLQEILEKDGRFEIVAVADVNRSVKMGHAHLGIDIPEGFDEAIRTTRKSSPRLIIYYTQTEEKSRASVQKLQTLVRDLSDREVRLRLAGLGQESGPFLTPFRIAVKNTAEAREKGAFEFGRMIALLLVIMAVSFTLYPAIDMAAGEKERGTLETLFISGAGRFEIVLGKYLAIFVIALFGSFLNLVSMALTFGHFAYMATQQLDMKSMRETALIREPEPIESAAFAGDAGAISVNESGLVALWDVNGHSLPFPGVLPHVTCVGISPDRSFALFGTDTGTLWRWDFDATEAREITRFPGPVTHLALSRETVAAVAGGKVLVLSPRLRSIDRPPGAIMLSPNGRYLAVFGDSPAVVDLEGDGVLEIPGEVTAAAFSPDGTFLLCGDRQGELALYRAATGKELWAQGTEAEPAHLGPVTALVWAGDGMSVASGGGDTICLWEFLREPAGLGRTQTLEADGPVLALDFTGDRCLSVSADGNLKVWQQSPDISFSLPFSVLATALLVLIPMISLFAAIALALSVFAQSYKEAQYYLTPLIIVVMPLAMVALIPQTSLTPLRCCIPVTSVVLLYKDMFMGRIEWGHILLVMVSNVCYAAFALFLTVRLFHKESVLFREAQGRKWEFWSEGGERQEVFTMSQALSLFLSTMVLFHFVGPYMSGRHFIWGQMVSQLVFLALFPCLGAMLFGLSLKKTFYWKLPRLREVGAAVLLSVSGLILAREVSVLQRCVLPVDLDQLRQMQEWLERATAGISPGVLFLGLAIVPGVCEELFFRGIMLSSGRRQMGPAKSIFLSAFFFAVMHLNFANFSFYLILGVVLGFLVLRTGSIATAVLAHVINNGVAIFAGSAVQGTSLSRAADPHAFLPLWLTLGALAVFALGIAMLQKPRESHR